MRNLIHLKDIIREVQNLEVERNIKNAKFHASDEIGPYKFDILPIKKHVIYLSEINRETEKAQLDASNDENKDSTK